MTKFAYKTGERPLDGYTIKRGVGIGGFGDVYFAVTDGGKEVALKRIQRNLDIEVRGVTQCLNLKHPNLISLYDLKYDEEGQAWVVMEYVSGESLRDVIERNPNGMPPEEAERWLREIAAGVGYLHDRGIVHRDLKPGNIFDDDGVVKIGDYGLSKFISTSRRSGQTESVGTFHYMAPEIGKGVYGKEIDIYALGIILYEMLTGRVPFDGESSQEIIMKHLTDNPDLTGIAQPYRDVIQRALRKDPEKRFRNVQEMLNAIDASRQQAVAPAAAVRPVSKEEPLYIGDDKTEKPPDIVFGPVIHHEVVPAEVVPPVRHVATAAPRPLAANPPRPRPPMSGGAKALLAVAIVLVIWFNPWLVPLAVVVGGLYVCYLGVRGLASCVRGSVSARAACTRVGDPVWRAVAREKLRKKPGSQRLAELTGSMLSAAVIAAILCLVFLALQGQTLDGSVAGWAVYAWLAVTSTVGAWLVLLAGKFWEGNDGGFRRRLVTLLAGLVIGGVAFGAGRLFLVDLPDLDHWTAHPSNHPALNRMLYANDGTPLLAAYLIYFAGLFVILRWWTQTDPLRKTRLSLWATATCLLWAWIMHTFCQFPQPWGFAVAAAISVAVQLAAPWVNWKEREAIGHVAREA